MILMLTTMMITMTWDFWQRLEALDVFFKCLPHNWSRSLFECPATQVFISCNVQKCKGHEIVARDSPPFLADLTFQERKIVWSIFALSRTWFMNGGFSWIFHHLCHEVLERRWVQRWSQLQVHPSEPLRALRWSKPRGSARRVLTKTSKISTDAQYMSLKDCLFQMISEIQYQCIF